MFNKEKVDKFYNIYSKYRELRVQRKDSEKIISLPLSHRDNYFTFDYKVENTEQAEKLFAEGKIEKISVIDLYKIYSELTDDEIFIRLNGYDTKTKEIIDTLYNKINFVDFKSDYEEIDEKYFVEKLEETKMIFFHRKNKGLYKVDNKYIAIFIDVYYPDDYGVTKYYFDKKPTAQDLENAFLIDRLDDELKKYFTVLNGLNYNRCLECEKKLNNWYDNFKFTDDVESDIKSIFKILDKSLMSCQICREA